MTAWHQLARIATERMLNGVIEGMVIALFAGLMLHLMRRQNLGRSNSGTRFGLLLGVLFSIAALPVLGAITGSAGGSGRDAALWAVTVPSFWATCFCLAWVAIAAIGLARLGLGLWHLKQLRADSETIEAAELDPLLQQTLKEFQHPREVRLATSEKLVVPTAIGFFQPFIVLPEWTLREFSALELNSILIHELAHLQRRDDWTNLAQKVLRALLFFHPAVWWLERELSLEREMACDEIVLARTADARTYAECLVTVAEKSFMRRSLALAQAAVSRMRQTTQRVSRILHSKSPGVTRVWKPAFTLVTVVSGVFTVGLVRAPQLVAFRDSAPMVASASATQLWSEHATPVSFVKETELPEAPKVTLTDYKAKPARHPSRIAARPMEAVSTPPTLDQSTAKPTLASFQEDVTPTQTVLLVMRTERFGPAGTSWTIQMWRFTVLQLQQVPMGLKAPAKST